MTLPDALPDGSLTIGPHYVENPKGLLFDCDGTLLDSMPLFFHSWEVTCPKFGLSMTLDDFYGFAGMPLPDIVRVLHQQKFGSEASSEFVDRFLQEKQANHAQTEDRLGHPQPIACVVALARDAAARGIPVCVATSGLRTHVEAHIKAAGLSDLFEAEKIVTAADVAKGKPAPDIFIEAARRIGVDPSECRAYEDGGELSRFEPARCALDTKA